MKDHTIETGYKDENLNMAGSEMSVEIYSDERIAEFLRNYSAWVIGDHLSVTHADRLTVCGICWFIICNAA